MHKTSTIQIKQEKKTEHDQKPVQQLKDPKTDLNRHHHQHHRRWGEIKLEKLPIELDTSRLKQEKPILIDQPLLPAMLSPDNNLKTQRVKNEHSKSHHQLTKSKSTRNRIDSYIVNTIKLNQILKSRVAFDQVDLFRKPKKPPTNKPTTPKPTRIRSRGNRLLEIESNEKARAYLKRFVTIMALHVDFTDISSMALDILVDLLDHFLESFFKLMKNLKAVNLFDIQQQQQNPTDQIAKAPAGFYHSETYAEQALQELGLGSIRDLNEYYMNDIILYYRSTYDKVNKMYEAYKRGKHLAASTGRLIDSDAINDRLDAQLLDMDAQESGQTDLEIEEFMKNNELLNDESNLILGEFLNDLSSTNLDEEITKMLQMIGPDPFCLVPDNP